MSDHPTPCCCPACGPTTTPEARPERVRITRAELALTTIIGGAAGAAIIGAIGTAGLGLIALAFVLTLGWCGWTAGLARFPR